MRLPAGWVPSMKYLVGEVLGADVNVARPEKGYSADAPCSGTR